MKTTNSARDLQSALGYDTWRNFHGVIRRAQQLIANGTESGLITETAKNIIAGKGAKRKITDFVLDEQASELVFRLASSFKTNKFFCVRNELVILALLQKYCGSKGLSFCHQFRLQDFVFDACISNSVLIEFDEPHHASSRQAKQDNAKDECAATNGYQILRVDLSHDIIDVLLALEPLPL